MSVVKKAPSGGTHHPSEDQCSGADSNTTSTSSTQHHRHHQAASPADMGGQQKFPRSSREMRNMAEKMRRDKLNSFINELAGIIPMCSGSTKRLDKTSTLRLAANYICMHKILPKEQDEAEKAPPVLGGNVALNLAEAVGGFLLLVTSSGKLIYVTEAIEQFLGHSQVELLGHSIYNVIHPDDQEIFQQHLIPTGNSRVSFFCRMMEKALTRNDPGRYEIIHVVGHLKPIPPSANFVPASPTTSVVSPGARSSSDSEDNYETDGESDTQTQKAAINRIGTHMLISFVRVVKDRPITELSLVESTLDEYITRHGLTGNILYTDHRISFVTGLMPSDVIGKSAFSYMHPDDRVWSIVAQKLMFTSTQGQGIVSYRLKCCDGSLVTLRSRGYLEVDKQTGQVESFVCINTVVSIKESDDEIKNQRRKLLPLISSEECDDHLKTISNTLPPELLKDVMPLLTPEALKSLANSFQISELKESQAKKMTSLDTAGQPKPSLGASVDGISNRKAKERRSELSPYQSKPKKLCSLERFDSSPGSQCSIQSPEPEEGKKKPTDTSTWYTTSPKQTPMGDFNTVVTKNFSFDREQPKQIAIHNTQQLSPAASPQSQAFLSQYGNSNCCKSPGNQCNNDTSYTAHKVIQDNGIHSYQQNKSPNVLTRGSHSPLTNGDECIPGVTNVSMGGKTTSATNQINEDISGYSRLICSPSLEESVNSRSVCKERELRHVTRDMASPGGSVMNKCETDISSIGTFPFHTTSGDVLLNEVTDNTGRNLNPQDWRGGNTITSTRLSSPAVSPGCHNFQQMEYDNSTNSRNSSGAVHQGQDIHSQYSPNSVAVPQESYHYHQQQQQQQQQQPGHCYNYQQQLLQLPPSQHYQHQPVMPTANTKHNISITSPKFETEVLGQLSNQMTESNCPATTWQSRSGVVPYHPALATEHRSMVVPPEACYRDCPPSPQNRIQSHLSNKSVTANSKTFSPHLHYTPSHNEVKGKFL